MQLTIDGHDYWKLLSDVLPFFGAELPYSRAITRRSLQLSDHKRARLENLHDDLFAEIGFIKLIVRTEYELTSDAFAECISSIVELLYLFESLLNGQMRLIHEVCSNSSGQPHS